jgi:hypothetical protein
MDYFTFCDIMKHELPLNRKERFYTGTVLPALLFHHGLSNFFRFLKSITGFPAEINEATTGENFLFYTEYNLRESAGGRSVGAVIPTSTNETPDLIIEIIKPRRVFVIVEAKMFSNIQSHELTEQIRRQKEIVSDVLREKYSLSSEDFYHVALLPKGSDIEENREYKVVYWEFFLSNEVMRLTDNMFYNYLRYALDNYDQLKSKARAIATTVEFYMKGAQLYELDKDDKDFWVGRKKGEFQIIEDIKTGKWRTHSYCIPLPIVKTENCAF